MSFLSDLSRKLGFTSGGEEREEELEDSDLPEEEDTEEDEEERGAFRLSNPFRRGSSRPPEREEDAEEDEEDPAPRQTRRGNVIHDARMESRASQSAPSPSAYTHCERIVNVRQLEECRDIIKYLLGGESVLLNLENIDPKDCGRVVDLLSGAAFALQGRMIKIAHLSYLLAPENVEVVEADAYAARSARYR